MCLCLQAIGELVDFTKGWGKHEKGLLTTELPSIFLFTDQDPNNFSVHPSSHLPIHPIIYLSIQPAVPIGVTL